MLLQHEQVSYTEVAMHGYHMHNGQYKNLFENSKSIPAIPILREMVVSHLCQFQPRMIVIIAKQPVYHSFLFCLCIDDHYNFNQVYNAIAFALDFSYNWLKIGIRV